MKGHPTTPPPPDLTVYPTAVALRQAQRRALDREGFFDGRGHITLAALLRECAESAAAAGLVCDHRGHPLRALEDLDRNLAIVDTVTRFRTTRAGHDDLLASLATTALEETLVQLVDTVSPLANRAPDFIALLAKDRHVPKNPSLAALYTAYTQVCHSLGAADDAELNAAILALLGRARTLWPASLRPVGTVAFISVRWMAPFLESFVTALGQQLGPEQVTVRHILTDYEQEWWGGRLLPDTGRLLFGEAQARAAECEFQSPATRAAIEELTSLREGLAMQDRALAAQARSHTGFSCSVGVYGEVEDLARRIAWELNDRPDPLRPEEICLVSRSLGAASDAIMDVFTRFNIPYYFRRGVPVLAVPVVKTLLDFARFSATRGRDVFCALLQSPWVDWSHTGIDPVRLADDLVRSGVEPVIDDPDRLARRLVSHALDERRVATRSEAEASVAPALRAYRAALGRESIRTFDAGLADLEARCMAFRVGTMPPPPPGDSLSHRAYLLNTKAWETGSATLSTLRRHALLNRRGHPAVAWPDLIDLLNKALENATVASAPHDEAGVWILNPYDMAGLSFKVVLIAGLNAGAFPKSPSPSPLFPDAELLDLRERLLDKGPLPLGALAASLSRNAQENLLFLTTLATAREQIVFSYAGHDEAGQELTPSVFFSTLWRLVGWPAWQELPAEPSDGYDRWRLTRGAPHLQAHWERHRQVGSKGPLIPAFKRRPFPGESYLGTVPLGLCRAADEYRQRLVTRSDETAPSCNAEPHESAQALATHILHGIRIEGQRQSFFAEQCRELLDPGQVKDPLTQPGHDYAGVLDPELWSRIQPTQPDGVPDLSPTQLERLVACPYQYYLQYILQLEALEPNDLEADSMDFGTAIHFIMNLGFRLFQGLAPDHTLPGIEALAQSHRRLFTPAWAIPGPGGLWQLQQGGACPGDTALPLVNLPADGNSVLEFFDHLTETTLDWATSGNAVWMLGAPEQITVQRRRISRAIRNLVRTALAPAALPEVGCCEGRKRYPALLEYTFSNRSRRAAGPSLELTDPNRPGHLLRLHGKIDRVDFVFDDGLRLAAAIVVDYKGGSKAQLSASDLAEGIRNASDSQLPAYALAARHALGAPASLPILMQYLSYTLTTPKLVKQCRTQWISLDGDPVEEADLGAAFTASAFAALNRYERGDFAVAPRACEFCNLKACCRHAASLLSPESQENGGEP